MVTRGDIIWADLGEPAGRRPVCVLTRDAGIPVLNTVTCAPITRTIRGILSEVQVGPEQGLPDNSAIVCDNILTVPQTRLDSDPVGHLDEVHVAALDRAQRCRTRHPLLIEPALGFQRIGWALTAAAIIADYPLVQAPVRELVGTSYAAAST